MAGIRVLSPEVAARIAAGEVVERPASVVKELVENALDAGATSVSVVLEKAGRTLIRVSDNGSGISAEDVDKLFCRHATSKIEDLDDVGARGLFGFRGEALYSIAAVSDVVLRTKTPDAREGVLLHVRAGHRIEVRPVGMNSGTEVEVRELFFNTPARRRFLKTDATELSRAMDAFFPYALQFPERRFTFVHNGRELLNLAPHAGHAERAAAATGLCRERFLEGTRSFPAELLRVHLLCGDASVRRPRPDLQFVFVNGRPVASRPLQSAVNQAFRRLLPAESWPCFLLFVEVPARSVDVNVHPAKREVKMKDEYAICRRIESFCGELLVGASMPKQVFFPPVSLSGGGRTTQETPVSEAPLPYVSASDGTRGAGTLREKLASCRFVGVFRNTYLLFESGESLLVMDQHAAHERISFERLKRQIETGRVDVQHLLTPAVVALSPQEMVAWEEGGDALERAGFATTKLDSAAIAVHTCPAILRDAESAVRGLLAGGNLSLCDAQTLARRACRMSVMAGEPLTGVEADRVRVDLLSCEDPFVCPHGRPTVIEITEQALAKQFLRG